MFLDEVITRIQNTDARIIGRIWVKEIGSHFDDKAVYTSSVQALCTYFQKYLEEVDGYGCVIADNRTHALNNDVAHSVFTRKFSAGQNAYNRIIEVPTFGNSDNHAGLQVCDLIVSALVWPIAVNTYCDGHVQNAHVRPGYDRIKTRFAHLIRPMQYRYDDGGKRRGGLVVSDGIGKTSGGRLFQ